MLRYLSQSKQFHKSCILIIFEEDPFLFINPHLNFFVERNVAHPVEVGEDMVMFFAGRCQRQEKICCCKVKITVGMHCDHGSFLKCIVTVRNVWVNERWIKPICGGNY